MGTLVNLRDYYKENLRLVKRIFEPNCRLIIDGCCEEQSPAAVALLSKDALKEAGLEAVSTHGFSTKATPTAVNAKEFNKALKQGLEPKKIWHAVLFRRLCNVLDEPDPAPGPLADAVKWHASNIIPSSRLFHRLDVSLDQKFFLVCDLLPLSKEPEALQLQIIQGLLQCALDTRETYNIVVKAVITPEMHELFPFNFAGVRFILEDRCELFCKKYRWSMGRIKKYKK